MKTNESKSIYISSHDMRNWILQYDLDIININNVAMCSVLLSWQDSLSFSLQPWKVLLLSYAHFCLFLSIPKKPQKGGYIRKYKYLQTICGLTTYLIPRTLKLLWLSVAHSVWILQIVNFILWIMSLNIAIWPTILWSIQ